MQMCREMAEEASETHSELSKNWKFDFEHNMSCEVVPFKQAYLTRNFCGLNSKVKVFADIMDLANESGKAKTAFGGEVKIPEGTVFLAGTSCKSFSGLRTFSRVENLREKTISGETFFAAVAYMMKAKPYISIFENTYNAPWYMMRQYLECRLPLWTCFLQEGSSKKGGKKKAQSTKMPLMTFLPKKNGKWMICDIPGNVGVRREAYVEGYVKNDCDDRSKAKPLIHDKRRDPNQAVPLEEFVQLYGLDMCKHTLIFDNGGVEFKTQVIKLDTKNYGLPQTRQRGYLFVWRRDWTKDLEKPLSKIDMSVGDLFLDLVESLAEPVQFPLHGLLPKDIDPRVRRFREVLRGPIGARTARDLARNNDFLLGKSSNTKYVIFSRLFTYSEYSLVSITLVTLSYLK